LGKGAETRERILRQAVRQGSRDGLAGLTVARLAEQLGLSKSGLFAHFGSKDALDVQVLQTAAARFRDTVLKPALLEPAGEPRIRSLFDRWLSWCNDPEMLGGCILIAAGIEVDDQPGPARDFMLTSQRGLMAALAKAARVAIEAGHFRADLRPEQFGFELYAIVLGYHHAQRLLRDPRATELARGAFERLLADAGPPTL